MKQVNVDIKLGELRQEVFIPMYIGEKRIKDIHIVVKDGEYEIVKGDNKEDDILEFLKRNADTINNILKCADRIDKRDKDKLKLLLQEII